MTAIIHRSALVYHGHQVPGDLAFMHQQFAGRLMARHGQERMCFSG